MLLEERASREDEIEAARNGDREFLAKNNMGFAVALAKKFARTHGPRKEYETYISAALLGLWVATDTYDGTTKMSTWSYRPIMWHMLEERRRILRVCSHEVRSALTPGPKCSDSRDSLDLWEAVHSLSGEQIFVAHAVAQGRGVVYVKNALRVRHARAKRLIDDTLSLLRERMESN